MKSHAWKPLFVFIGVIILALIARYFVVPRDFTVGERGFMYSYHRASNVDEWMEFEVKYQGKEYCSECHEEKYEANMASKHKIIQCENCHGPGSQHNEKPHEVKTSEPKMTCIQCHTPEHSGDYAGNEDTFLERIKHWTEPNAPGNVK